MMYAKRTVLVLAVCSAAAAVALPYSLRGNLGTVAVPPARAQKGNPRHAVGFLPPRRVPSEISRIIFLKNLLEVGCLKEFHDRQRLKYPQGVRRPSDTRRPPAFGIDREIPGPPAGGPPKSEDPNRRHPGIGRIIFLRPPPPKSQVKGSQNGKDVARENPPAAQEAKEQTLKEEKGAERPQGLSAVEETSSLLAENPSLGEEFRMTVNFGEDSFSHPPKKIKTTTPAYPKSSSYDSWHLTRPEDVHPYEVEEVIEEKLSVNWETDDVESAATPQVHSQEKVIEDSVGTIVKNLIHPEVEGNREKTPPGRVPPHTLRLGPGEGRRKQTTKTVTEKTFVSNGRTESHRSLDLTPYEAIGSRTDPSEDSEESQELERTSVFPFARLDSRTSLRSPDSESSASSRTPDHSWPATEKSEASSSLANATRGIFGTRTTNEMTVPSKILTTPGPVEEFSTPELPLARSEDRIAHKTMTYFSKAGVGGVRLTTPNSREFTDHPLNFDLLPQTTKKDDGNWKNSRKMHFGMDSPKEPRGGESEQRRSDILIVDTREEYEYDENQLLLPSYLESLRKNASATPDLSSLVPLVPAIVGDLRGNRISSEDVAVLSKAFGRHWPRIVALSNVSDLDMLPLLRMKSEGDLEEVLNRFLLEDSVSTTASEGRDDGRMSYLDQSYDYAENYGDLYEDVEGRERGKFLGSAEETKTVGAGPKNAWRESRKRKKRSGTTGGKHPFPSPSLPVAA